MSITFYGAMGLGQISLDHPSGVDWINQRNLDMRVISDLVAVYPFTPGVIPYVNAGGKLDQSLSEIFWDATNKIFRVGKTGAMSAALSQTMSGLELVTGGANGANQYGFGIKFINTDPDFTTRNPKWLAGIFPRSTQAYTGDTTGGMVLDFFYTPTTPGADPIPSLGMSVDANGLNLNANSALILGAFSTIAISVGALTVLQKGSIVRPTPETGTVDDLTTINGSLGQLLILFGLAGNIITVKNGTGNIQCGSDCVLNGTNDNIILVNIANTWYQLSRSLDN